MKAPASDRTRALERPRRFSILVFLAGLALLAGCGPADLSKGVTELQRKEAAHAESEAQFAATLRQWERAEGLFVRAAQLCPDTGAYGVSLGVTRIRLGRREAAKAAFQGALRAFEAEAARKKTEAEPWLKQVEVLALLGRVDEARARLAKADKHFPHDRAVRFFIEHQGLDRLLADPAFKQNAL